MNKFICVVCLMLLSACGGGGGGGSTDPVPANIPGAVAIVGVAQKGKLLTANISDENGVVSSSAVVSWYADNSLIAGQSGLSMTLTSAEVGKKISVKIHYTDGQGFKESIESSPTQSVLPMENGVGVITITDASGGAPVLQEGSTLYAKIVDANTVSNSVDFYWYLDDVLVPENNKTSYLIAANAVGKRLYVKALYVDGDGYAENIVSTNTDFILPKNTGIAGGKNYSIGAKIDGGNSIVRNSLKTNESFEGAGWNAGSITGTYTPGLNTSLPKSFKFAQLQGPHSFSAETSLTRFGNYSAKMHWKHENPAQWNGDPNVLDNVDRKAMFHGNNANQIISTLWYGFSVYFPSDKAVFTGSQQALFFQLHGATDAGEASLVPPIALNIAADGFKLTYTWDSAKLSTSTDGEGRDQIDLPVNIAEYQNRWVDFVIQVGTNPFESKGFLKLWIDGVQVINQANIKVGYNDDKGVYPSWGWYLWGSNATRSSDAILYLDELRQAEGAEIIYHDVAPGYFDKASIQ